MGALYQDIANIKKREYGQNVENASFTPMILSSSGGMGDDMSMALKILARRITLKKNQSYATTMGLLRCRFAFEMMRSALICLRGSRSLKPKSSDLTMEEVLDASAEVVTMEAKIAF